ncbi:MAG: hypothetical protein JWN04_6581 [Myxococcaceae bacterium]|nr:hypothetical protein [Myxococcaceae bacterium]
MNKDSSINSSPLRRGVSACFPATVLAVILLGVTSGCDHEEGTAAADAGVGSIPEPAWDAGQHPIVPRLSDGSVMPSRAMDAGTSSSVPAGSCAVTVAVQKITTPTTWANSSADCDYFVQNYLELNSTLTIEPGTVVQFGPDTIFNVGAGGKLLAVGQPDHRIALRGAHDSQGYWNALWFESGSLASQLEYVDLVNAGQESPGIDSGKHNTGIGGNGTITFKHNRVSGSAFDGASFGENLKLSAFEHNIFENNARFGLQVAFEQIHLLDTASDYLGRSRPNGKPYVYAFTPALHDYVAGGGWSNIGAPLYIDYDFTIASPLDIGGGVKIVAGKNLKITVDGYGGAGSLFAVGTSEPVVFTSANPVQGSWRGIEFSQSSATLNMLANVRIEYAGSGPDRSAIQLKGVNQGDSVTITTTTFVDSGHPLCEDTRLTHRVGLDNSFTQGEIVPCWQPGDPL